MVDRIWLLIAFISGAIVGALFLTLLIWLYTHNDDD